jgi:hypothetical protein
MKIPACRIMDKIRGTVDTEPVRCQQSIDTNRSLLLKLLSFKPPKNS